MNETVNAAELELNVIRIGLEFCAVTIVGVGAPPVPVKFAIFIPVTEAFADETVIVKLPLQFPVVRTQFITTLPALGLDEGSQIPLPVTSVTAPVDAARRNLDVVPSTTRVPRLPGGEIEEL